MHCTGSTARAIAMDMLDQAAVEGAMASIGPIDRLIIDGGATST